MPSSVRPLPEHSRNRPPFRYRTFLAPSSNKGLRPARPSPHQFPRPGTCRDQLPKVKRAALRWLRPSLLGCGIVVGSRLQSTFRCLQQRSFVWLGSTGLSPSLGRWSTPRRRSRLFHRASFRNCICRCFPRMGLSVWTRSGGLRSRCR